jgi:hypothetical protein
MLFKVLPMNIQMGMGAPADAFPAITSGGDWLDAFSEAMQLIT